MTRHAVLAAAMAGLCSFAPLPAQAAMGLRCSDWLNARAHMRYDDRLKRAVPVNPAGAPPVPKWVDEKSAFVNAYVAGIVETLLWLDVWLAKMAETPGVKLPPRVDLPALLDRVDELCRGGLQTELRDHDVLDIVSLNNQATVMLRVQVIQDLMEKYMEAGRREGQRSR